MSLYSVQFHEPSPDLLYFNTLLFHSKLNVDACGGVQQHHSRDVTNSAMDCAAENSVVCVFKLSYI